MHFSHWGTFFLLLITTSRFGFTQTNLPRSQTQILPQKKDKEAVLTGSVLHCALSPDGAILAAIVHENKSDTLLLLATNTLTPLQCLPLEPFQTRMAWSPDSRQIFLSGGKHAILPFVTRQEDGSFVAERIVFKDILDAEADFSDVAIGLGGDFVYAANRANDTVYAFHTRSKQVRTVQRFDTGSRPQTLHVAPDGTLFVLLGGTNRIAILDGKTLELRRTITPFGHARTITASDKTLYLLYPSNQIAQIEWQSSIAEKSDTTKSGLQGLYLADRIVFAAHQKRIYMLGQKKGLHDGNLVLISMETQNHAFHLFPLEAAGAIHDFALSNDAKTLYVFKNKSIRSVLHRFSFVTTP